MSMTIVRTLCEACPQDLVVRLDESGVEVNFYFRHGVARLYRSPVVDSDTPMATMPYVGKADPMADGILPLDEVEAVVRQMLRVVLS